MYLQTLLVELQISMLFTLWRIIQTCQDTRILV